MLKDRLASEDIESFMKKMRSPISLHNVPFYYVISQMQFTLDDMKHGILRGNKKSPDALYQKQFSENDLRNKIIKVGDFPWQSLISLID